MNEPATEPLSQEQFSLADHDISMATIYEQAPIGLCVLDTEYRFLRINARMAGINGASIQDHLGRFIWEVLPVPESEFRNPGQKVLDTREPVLNVDVAFDGIHDDDRAHHYLAHWHPLFKDDTIFAFNIVFEDITRQRRSTREGRLLRSIIDTIPIMISIWNKSAPGFRLNNEVQRATGYSRKELDQPDILEKVYPDSNYREEVIEYMRRLSKEWKEVKMTAKDGSVIDTLWYNMELNDDLCVGIGLDNRARKAAECEVEKVRDGLESTVQERTNELRQRTQELEERSEQLAELALELNDAEMVERRKISNALHDSLQQLLGVVKIKLNMMRDSGMENKELLEMIQETDKLLAEAIDFTRNLSYELFPPILYKLGLGATLEWLAEQVNEKYHLYVHVEHNTGDIQIDKSVREFFYQAAKELLYNIVKHADVDEAYLNLTIRKGWILMTVEDHGKGFKADNIRPRARETSGFGLFRLRERIQLLRGDLNVVSQPGRGSRFEIHLPLDPSKPLTRQKSAPPKYKEKPVKKGVGVKVMITDDHKIMREGLASVISRQSDLEVIAQAEDGQQAIDLAQRLRPDLIIMDISMPVLDGIKATERIRKDLPAIKIIGLSMFEEDFLRKRMLDAGAVECLSKSGPTDDLLRAIRQCFVASKSKI